MVARHPIACAYEHTIATDTQGKLWGWGNNARNQLLKLAESDLILQSPRQIDGLPPIFSVHCGYSHTIAIDINKNLWSWGWNSYGQLGYASLKSTSSHICKIENLPPIIQVSCGINHSLALDENGNIWSWGLNISKQLGTQVNQYSSTPTMIKNLPKIITIAAGGNCSAAIDNNNQLWIWGTQSDAWNPYFYSPLNNPKTISTKHPIKAISLGLNHAVAIDSDNNLISWGQDNCYGKLGRSTRCNIPDYIHGLPQMKSVSCGETATCAIDINGIPWVWGRIVINRRDSSTPSFTSTVPVKLEIPNETSFVYISCGSYHLVAIDEQDNVWSWGENDRGQLGLGHTLTKQPPEQIEFLKISPNKLFLPKKCARISLH